MKLRKVIYIPFAIIIFFTGYKVYYTYYKPLNNSTTISAKVIDKLHSKDKYIVEIVEVNNKGISGKVIIEEENIWNLIEKDREYFMVLNFESTKMHTQLFSEGAVTLQQIDILN